MATTNHEHVGSMSWDEIEDALQPSARGARAKGKSADEQALREYFGDAEFEYLQKLASHATMMRTRAVAPLGNVILVPGIMGSSLASTRGTDVDAIWLNFSRIALGRVERLRLTPDGKRDADSSLSVAASELFPLAYARTILWMRARWNVEPYAFDWRKDIDVASNGLARLVREKFRNKPVHIVAHSMGGLVSRNFIRLHRDLWDEMQDNEGGRGGRLVMLGTPNYGSFAIPQVLTGTETLVRWLARADIRHSRAEVLEILNTFVGSYQMLPAPSKISSTARAIYRSSTWGDFPVSETHLQRAMQFHDALEQAAHTIDPERMIYVAGCGRETLSGLNILSPGEFDYTTTFDGDGRVPHALGLLKDVATYYADASHGDLPKKELVLTAIDELLERGRTTLLPQQPPVVRSVRAEAARWTRGAGVTEVGAEIETVARRTFEPAATKEEKEKRRREVREAENTLLRAVVGEDIEPEEVPQVAEEEKAKRKRAHRIRLAIRAVRGDISRVRAPLVAVGHYQGVAPGGAEGALDRAIDFWISRAGEQGMIGAGLGQLFFIPVPGNMIPAERVLLAGMGEFGKFRSGGEVRFLMMNVTLAVATLGLERFATVVIGSGQNNMSKENALRGMLQGVCEAVHRLNDTLNLKQLIIVEYDDDDFKEIVTILKKFKEKPPVDELAITLSTQRLPKSRKQPKRERPQDADAMRPGASQETRINIERSGDSFRFSAITANAVIPVRDEVFKQKYVADASERLMTSLKQEEQEKYGQLLYTYLFPADFHQAIDTDKPLTLVLDRATAGLPWEMAAFRGPQGMAFLGPELKLTRQFRTLLSSAPGVTPPPKRSLKVLVIADPAREPELQLPGALREGRAVVEILNKFRKMPKRAKEELEKVVAVKVKKGKAEEKDEFVVEEDEKIEMEIVERIGAAECDATEILALILNENFDLIHYAGHGIFDAETPSNSGWIFGKEGENKYLTLAAREIFKARRVPLLVFANACFSAVVREGKAATADEMNRDLAGMAEAFFERGVQNYIGAGWPVDDAQAVPFAKTFYYHALKGNSLGDSLAEARKAILGQGSTWGAYHHYGRAHAPLISS